MYRRARYQRGSLQCVRRKSGPAVWQFRWYETQGDGSKKYRKAVLGSVEQFKTETEAQAAADALRLTINDQTARQELKAVGFASLVEHYREHEMPDIFFKEGRKPTDEGNDEMRKSYATQYVYDGYLKKWILPKWSSFRLQDVKAVAVEKWLRSLPLARGSKAKIRNIMSALYSHAIRWEWIRHNPISSVRQSAKRSKVPTILTIGEIQSLLKHLQEPCRTALLLDAATGLRVSELLGLRWEDIDFEKLEINVARSVVRQRVGRCKTEASSKPLPLDAELAQALRKWMLETVYNQPQDWVFASPQRNGKQPYWPYSLFREYLQPALKAAGITRQVGWHTLRHTFGTLMKANGEDIKTIQELLRHSNYRVTADIYTQAVTPKKREAQSRVVRMILPESGGNVIEPFQTPAQTANTA